jgi:preprotein translocase subunit Sss1
MEFDDVVEIPYDIQQLLSWRKSYDAMKIKFIRCHFPKTLEFLTERQVRTLSHQSEGHYPEIKAMNWFLSCGFSAYYVESGFITSYNDEIKQIIERNFTREQSNFLFSVKHGGIPDLLIGKDNNWRFVEVKMIHKRADKPTKKELETFPLIQNIGIRIDLAKVIPEFAK